MKCWTMLKAMSDGNQTSFSTTEKLYNILQQGGQTSATYWSQPSYDVACISLEPFTSNLCEERDKVQQQAADHNRELYAWK